MNNYPTCSTCRRGPLLWIAGKAKYICAFPACPGHRPQEADRAA